MDETARSQTWEDETLDLIRRLEEDRLKKAEQRLAAAQRAVSSVRGQIDALRVALDVYRNEHGLARADVEVPDAEEVAEYQHLSVKEMLYRWAELHGGRVVMRDATKFLAAAGLFRDETQAAGALYPAASRADDFEKVSRGVYRKVAGVSEIVAAETPDGDELGDEQDGPMWQPYDASGNPVWPPIIAARTATEASVP